MVQDSDKSSKDVKKVSAQCKKQVKYELMVQSENIELNSPLYEACKKDLQTFCPDVAHDQGKVRLFLYLEIYLLINTQYNLHRLNY